MAGSAKGADAGVFCRCACRISKVLYSTLRSGGRDFADEAAAGEGTSYARAATHEDAPCAAQVPRYCERCQVGIWSLDDTESYSKEDATIVDSCLKGCSQGTLGPTGGPIGGPIWGPIRGPSGITPLRHNPTLTFSRF